VFVFLYSKLNSVFQFFSSKILYLASAFLDFQYFIKFSFLGNFTLEISELSIFTYKIQPFFKTDSAISVFPLTIFSWLQNNQIC